MMMAVVEPSWTRVAAAVATPEATGGLLFVNGEATVTEEVRLGLSEGRPEAPSLLPWGGVDGRVEEVLRPQGEEGGNASGIGAHVVLYLCKALK